MGIENLKRSIGARLKDERKKRGLQQGELAEISDVAIKTIGQIENFRGNPTLKTLDKLAKTFGIKLEDFFNGFE